jgi:protein TonB
MMKRLMPALMLSLGIHALVFQMNAGFVLKREATIRKTHTLSITLFEPERQKPKKSPQLKKRKTKKLKKIPPPAKIPVKEAVQKKEQKPEQVAPSHFENRVINPENEGAQAVIKAFPMYKKNLPPAYPEAARRRGYQGTVVLEVLVNANGGVSDLKIAESSNYPVLDRSALNSVKKWSFVPGMRGSKSVETWVRVPVRFRLEK